MNMAMPMQYSIPGGAVAFTGSSSQPDPFDKSPLNPVNMSRTPDRTTSGSAPSSKLLDRVRVAASDLAELASVQAGWRYVTEKGNTTIYEMNGAVLPRSVSVAASFGGAGGKASDYYLVKGVTTVSVDVDHVLELLTAPATEAYALRMNQIFGKQFYQNAVVIDQLSCTEPPAQFRSQDGHVRSYTQDDAYAVNWLSLKTASVTEGARDFTVASYQDAFQRDARGALVRLGRRAAKDPPRRGDATDRLLGVHALTSFNFKDVPALPKTRNTERLHFRNTGFVVEETHERGVFRLSFFLSLMPVAATLRSPKKYEKWLQGLAMCVGNLALQAKPQQVLSHAKKTQWKDSDHCMLCLKSFYAFRRCHHCRFCGEAVCNKCSGFVDVSKFDVVQTLNGSMRPAANPSLSDHYSETRGCSRCIRQLMEDYANSNVSLVGGLDSQRRSSTTGSRSSGRSSKNTSFLSNQQQLVAPSDDEDAISLSGSSDRLSSDSFSGASAYQRPQPNLMTGFSSSVVRQRNDVEEYESAAAKAQASFAKPPLHVDPKLSMSTTSTSFSNPSFADDRVSAGSHASQQRWNPNMSAGPTLGSNARPPMDFQSDYLSDDDVLNLTGLSIHNDNQHQQQLQNPYSQSQPQLHDDETDIDTPPMFARSMISAKCLSISKTTASSAAKELPPRSTVSSSRSGDSGSNSFKFSMMSQNLSLSSEPEAEPQANDSFTGGYMAEPQQQDLRTTSVRPNRVTSTTPSSAKLFSMSAGPRLHSQSIPQQRPPRPQPAFYQEPARSSSSGSSRASLPMSEDMFVLAPAAMAMANAGGSSESDHSDMILLAPKKPQTPQFVEFSDSHRESIFVRPGDGSDMIPLKF